MDPRYPQQHPLDSRAHDPQAPAPGAGFDADPLPGGTAGAHAGAHAGAPFEADFRRDFAGDVGSGPAAGARGAARPPHGGGVLGDPRRRSLVLALGALALLLVVGMLWWSNPERRARRELAQANARIAEKERGVLEARQLLERRIAELREARATADVEATIYDGVLERETTGTAAAVGAAGAPTGRIGETRSVGGEVIEPRRGGEPVRVERP